MKRDMDLIRLILLEVEKHPYGPAGIELTIEGFTSNEVHYHVMLLSQAGLIEATDHAVGGQPTEWYPTTLTWEGHEFLEASKDEGRWNKAKAITKEKVGGTVFEVFKSVLVEMAKNAALGSL